MKNEKGITLIILVLTILLLIIVTALLASHSNYSLEALDITKLISDVESLNNKIETYYLKYDKLPTYGEAIPKEDISEAITDLNTDDGTVYYAIDLQKLDNPTLYFGNGYDVPNEDTYLINEETHTIYYLKGVTYQEKVYHNADKFTEF